MKPKVSILCITFNQSRFIRQAIDSFLSQKTDFQFEILIHDDKSTDGTTQIIQEYEKAHPEIIKPIYEKENQYSQANYSFIVNLYAKARGQYIAFCEGDDYWTDNHKLQEQVDFLDKHPDYALCFHPAKVVFENNKEADNTLFPDPNDKKKFDLKRLLQANFMQTSSVMYRNVGHYDEMASDPVPGDWYAHLFHAAHGKIGFIPTAMSVYRRHDGGVWWNAHGDITKIWRKHGIGHLRLYHAMLKLFGGDPNRRKIVVAHIHQMLENIFELEDADDVKRQVAAEFPEATQRYLSDLRKNYIETQARLEQMSPQFEALKEEYGKLSQHTKNVEKQLELIQSSRVWKLRNKAARLIGKDEN